MATREWTDRNTGHRVIQVTDHPEGAFLDYFRHPRNLPDGRFIALAGTSLLLIDPDSLAIETRPIPTAESRPARPLGRPRLRPGSWSCALLGKRTLWRWDLRTNEVSLVAKIPPGVPGNIEDVAADGETIILLDVVQDTSRYPIPTTMDLDAFWGFVNRPRHGTLHTWNCRTGASAKIHETKDVCPSHVEASPRDARCIRFCLDMFDAFGQRIWTVLTDGTLTKIRPQEWGEIVTHEFWALDATHIGYTYQDRRHDPTIREKPWSEYSPMPTQFGLADLSGHEVYLSDPLNSYHTHLLLSESGRLLTGEGTDGNSFVFTAPFDRTNPRIDMKALATIHTPYVPFRGQNVDCSISTNDQWLLFNDQIDGKHQVCKVKLPF